VRGRKRAPAVAEPATVQDARRESPPHNERYGTVPNESAPNGVQDESLGLCRDGTCFIDLIDWLMGLR